MPPFVRNFLQATDSRGAHFLARRDSAVERRTVGEAPVEEGASGSGNRAADPLARSPARMRESLDRGGQRPAIHREADGHADPVSADRPIPDKYIGDPMAIPWGVCYAFF